MFKEIQQYGLAKDKHIVLRLKEIDGIFEGSIERKNFSFIIEYATAEELDNSLIKTVIELVKGIQPKMVVTATSIKEEVSIVKEEKTEKKEPVKCSDTVKAALAKAKEIEEEIKSKSKDTMTSEIVNDNIPAEIHMDKPIEIETEVINPSKEEIKKVQDLFDQKNTTMTVNEVVEAMKPEFTTEDPDLNIIVEEPKKEEEDFDNW